MMAASKAERGVLSGLLGLSRNLGLLAGASLMAAIFTALVGTGQIAQASASSIAAAFTVSFLISAALTALAMGAGRSGSAPVCARSVGAARPTA
jgi:hypothetical protein